MTTPRPGHYIETVRCTDEEIKDFAQACMAAGSDPGEWGQYRTQAFVYFGWHPQCGLYFTDKPNKFGPDATLWTPEPELPELGTEWVHHSGRIYRVTRIANQNTQRPEQYPVTIVYENVENGTVWSRPASDWTRSFKPRKRTVTINGHEVPAPETQAPKIGTQYWTFRNTDPDLVVSNVWSNDGLDRRLLNRGLVHLSEENALKVGAVLFPVLRGEK